MDDRSEAAKNAGELDDDRDRDELRGRFEMLLQELRVALPGVQILLAFLLTVPFSDRFDRLDGAGRTAYGIALTTSMLAVIAMTTPTLLHRLGERTARVNRLRWSIRLQLAGIAFLGGSLLSGLWAVARVVFGPTAVWLIVVPVAVTLIGAWLIVPLLTRRLNPARRVGRP